VSKKLFLFSCFLIIFGFQGFHLEAQEAYYRWKMLNLIRTEKFDLVLPKAMRENKVDMWIHVMGDGRPDPLLLDLADPLALDVGGSIVGRRTVYFIFTDRGGDRIERAILGGEGETEGYDIFGRKEDLRKFVEERDPKRIAVNFSENLAAADGISHTQYLKLIKELGQKYAKRVVSAEKVITDFRVQRVEAEIIVFAKACELQREIVEEGLRNIKAGVTSREDFGWWIEDQALARGLEPEFGLVLPGIMHSEVSPPSECWKPSYIIQKGDLLLFDWGVKYLNFGTDYKRYAYVLRDGEYSLPAGIQHAWERTLQAREIIRKTIKVGRTAGETLETLAQALEKEGFVYTPFTDIGSKDRELVNSLGDSEKSGFSIDCHCVGNTGHGDIVVGPSIAPFRKDRAHIKIKPNNLFAFEFMVHTWVPEWGKRLTINLEDNAIVTGRGVEFLYPPNERIILVR